MSASDAPSTDTPGSDSVATANEDEETDSLTTVSPTTDASGIEDAGKETHDTATKIPQLTPQLLTSQVTKQMLLLQIPPQVMPSQLMLQIPKGEIKKQMLQVLVLPQQLFQELKVKMKKQMNLPRIALLVLLSLILQPPTIRLLTRQMLMVKIKNQMPSRPVIQLLISNY